MKSIAIVSSTMPVLFLKDQTESLEVQKIYTTSEELYKSYLELVRIHPNLTIKILPYSAFMQTIFLFFILLKIRINSNQLIIFHECCMPILDLLIFFLRPKAQIFPQVTLNAAVEVPFNTVAKGRFLRLIHFFGLDRFFKFLYSPALGGNQPEYYLVFKQYPTNVKIHQVSRSYFKEKEETPKSNSVLILLGKSRMDDLEQIKEYNTIISFLIKKNYKVFIKDHPNPFFRLNLKNDSVTHIDPLIPSELLNENYKLVIGTSSTSILFFGDKVIGLIDYFKDITKEDRRLYKNLFNSSFPENKVLFPKSIEELLSIL